MLHHFILRTHLRAGFVRVRIKHATAEQSARSSITTGWDSARFRQMKKTQTIPKNPPVWNGTWDLGWVRGTRGQASSSAFLYTVTFDLGTKGHGNWTMLVLPERIGRAGTSGTDSQAQAKPLPWCGARRTTFRPKAEMIAHHAGRVAVVFESTI